MINLCINKSVESRTFERKLIWAPDEEVFIYFADTVNREPLLCRCWGHKKILSVKQLKGFQQKRPQAERVLVPQEQAHPSCKQGRVKSAASVL